MVESTDSALVAKYRVGIGEWIELSADASWESYSGNAEALIFNIPDDNYGTYIIDDKTSKGPIALEVEDKSLKVTWTVYEPFMGVELEIRLRIYINREGHHEKIKWDMKCKERRVWKILFVPSYNDERERTLFFKLKGNQTFSDLTKGGKLFKDFTTSKKGFTALGLFLDSVNINSSWYSTAFIVGKSIYSHVNKYKTYINLPLKSAIDCDVETRTNLKIFPLMAYQYQGARNDTWYSVCRFWTSKTKIKKSFKGYEIFSELWKGATGNKSTNSKSILLPGTPTSFLPSLSKYSNNKYDPTWEFCLRHSVESTATSTANFIFMRLIRQSEKVDKAKIIFGLSLFSLDNSNIDVSLETYLKVGEPNEGKWERPGAGNYAIETDCPNSFRKRISDNLRTITEYEPAMINESFIISKIELNGSDKLDEIFRFGSLYFKFEEIAEGAEDYSISTILHGSWSNSEEAKFAPEVKYEFPIKVLGRYGQDPSLSENNVILNTNDQSQFDRMAFSESDAFTLGESTGFDAILIIHEKHGIDRNPVITMELRSTKSKPETNRQLMLQFRPFMVAAIEQENIGLQANDVLAKWRSDDPDSPQWRWGNSSLVVSLPPSVGEDMYRGSRFESESFPEGGNPTLPICYRFTTPSRLQLKPGLKDRRYNTSAQNIDWLLGNAAVIQFRTEIVYPIVAEFRRDKTNLPDVRIREASERFGFPSDNLPSDVRDSFVFSHWSRFIEPSTKAKDEEANEQERERKAEIKNSVNIAFQKIRQTHRFSAFNYGSRLAEHELFDTQKQDQLKLESHLEFSIRKGKNAPSMSPLPKGSPLQDEMKKILIDDKSKGAIRAGILHTIEYESILGNILKDGKSYQGKIDSLIFSALGNTNTAEASFDNGRTTFSVVMEHGQVSSLINTRIGRIGALWNVAKHVIVYGRTVSSQQQFGSGAQREQSNKYDGWPILRKNEEYIEILEPVRNFDLEEEAKGKNVNLFIKESYFDSAKIHINGAWGRDLGVDVGYEIPLWQKSADPSIYPMPKIYLNGLISADLLAKLKLTSPDQLRFFASTKPSENANSNKWVAVKGVDFSLMARPGIRAKKAKKGSDALKPRLQSASSYELGWERFNLRVQGEQIDVAAGKSKNPIMASIERVLIARMSQTQKIRLTSEFATLEKLATKAKVIYSVISPIQSKDREATIAVVEHAIDLIKREFGEEVSKLLAHNKDCNDIRDKLDEYIDKTLIPNAKSFLEDNIENAIKGVKGVKGDVAKIKEELKGSISHSLFTPISLINQLVEELEQERNEIINVIDNATTTQISRIKKQSISFVELLINENKNIGTIKVPLIKIIEELSNEIKEAIKTIRYIETELSSDFESAFESFNFNVVGLYGKYLKGINDANSKLRGKFPPLITDIPNKLFLFYQKTYLYLKMKVDSTTTISNELKSYILAKLTLVKSTLDKSLDYDKQIENILSELNRFYEKVLIDEKKLDELILKVRSVDSLETLKELKSDFNKFFNLGWLNDSKNIYITELYTFNAEIEGTLDDISKSLAEPIKQSEHMLVEIKTKGEEQLTQIKEHLRNVVRSIDCTEFEKFQEALNRAFDDRVSKPMRKVVTDLEEEFGDTVEDIVNSEVITNIENEASVLAEGLSEIKEQGSKYLKLAKLVGEPPALPNLDFNIDRIEYVFDDAKKEIETSPMASRLREIDGALNELGIEVPTNKILDQLVPMKLKGLDIKRLFKSIAGIRFDHLFDGFRLPDILPDDLVVTHGSDIKSRSAWVESKVDLAFPDELQAFGGNIPVKVNNARFIANSKLTTSPAGTKNVTNGKIVGDWSLSLGGTQLATFVDVALIFDSDSGLSFDIPMDKVKLHPTISFVSKFAKMLGEKLPKGVELVTHKGLPVGVKSRMIIPVRPIQAGAFATSKFILSTGFSISAEPKESPTGVAISTYASVGGRKHPLQIQVGYLVGSASLEVSAGMDQYGELTPKASVTFGAGIGRSAEIAGVATASFSFLFFVNASADENGQYFEVGIQVAGNAQLLGYLSASIFMELKAISDGNSLKGHGTLDVSIDISWCYSVHIVRQVEQDL